MPTSYQQRATTRFAFQAQNSAVIFYPATAQDALSDREIEVLRHVAEGLSNKEIASTLNISAHTVARHVTNIMRKLDAANRAQAATMALRSGLLSYD
ncbi:MAG: response regulator transcription factor [Chloroflexi bacterium]|nr:response regulator transcription factor [Chloroflexota bacterium]